MTFWLILFIHMISATIQKLTVPQTLSLSQIVFPDLQTNRCTLVVFSWISPQVSQIWHFRNQTHHLSFKICSFSVLLTLMSLPLPTLQSSSLKSGSHFKLLFSYLATSSRKSYLSLCLQNPFHFSYHFFFSTCWWPSQSRQLKIFLIQLGQIDHFCLLCIPSKSKLVLLC